MVEESLRVVEEFLPLGGKILTKSGRILTTVEESLHNGGKKLTYCGIGKRITTTMVKYTSTKH